VLIGLSSLQLDIQDSAFGLGLYVYV
jgi:hypothetical protein